MNRVVRNILWGSLYTLLAAALAAYFYYARSLREKERANEVCTSVKVTILDSSLNKFVTKKEVVDAVNSFNGGETIGKRIDSMKLKELEVLLGKKSAIAKCEAFITRTGVMNVQITQRRPVIRIEFESGGYYIDETGYIFPLITNSVSYIPVVTGDLPINISPERKLTGKDSTVWVRKFIELGKFLQNNPFWNAQVEQIYFDTPACAELYTRVGQQKIILGDITDLKKKFDKLYAFYINAIPEVGWDRYSSIDLSFKGQIVCKKDKKQ